MSSEEDFIKGLQSDVDGMATYEYIVNNTDICENHIADLIENLKRVDLTGQFVASTARYLNAIDRLKFKSWINTLIEITIEKDRERRYLSSLLEAIWGADYRSRSMELSSEDDNFRRIYKRIYGVNSHGI